MSKRRLASRLSQLRRAKIMAHGALVAASVHASRYWQHVMDQRKLEA